MKKTSAPEPCGSMVHPVPQAGLFTRTLPWAAGLLLLGLAAPLASGQTVNFRAPRVRVTVPLNSTNTTVITNWVDVADLGGVPVNFEVTGLPGGAGYALTDTNGAPLLATLEDTNLCLTLYTTNLAEGEYTFSLNGTGGATNSVLLVLQAAHVWNGALAVAGPWSAAENWLEGVPGPFSDVVFGDLGSQTNTFTNSLVDADTTIASLRFAQTGLLEEEGTRRTTHTLQLATGKTLAVTGSKGFRLLRDYLSDNSPNTDFPTLYPLNVNIVGTNATLLVSNEAANVALTIEAQTAHTLDLSGLSRFVARVDRVGLGDYSLYPNFWNYDANGYNGVPRRFIPSVNFARTNLITALYADPNNYTNSEARLYSLTFVNSVYSGTTAIPVWNLGVTNAFFADSVCLVGANQQGRVQFNPAFATNTACFAYFRNTNGGRMSMFAISDEAGTNYGSSNIKSFIDFGSNGGSVDILTDRFYMTRDRKLLNGDPNFQGQLYMGKGIIDANTAILGYQEFTGRSTNTAVYRGYCQASITVSNTAVFKVNDTLELGYATETDSLAEPWENRGVINIGPGGTVRANTILYGGPAKVSAGSAINMTAGATLIVSNTVAGPDAYLPSLNMSDSILVLHLDGSRTEPYVYVTNLVCSGLSNQINLATITGVSSYPAQFPLIKYENGTANFSAKIPAGQFGFVLNNTANKTIDVYLFTNAPRTLEWRGNLSANWDTTTKNWVEVGGSTPTNFNQGDVVVFNDAATSTAINVVDGVFPGQITMDNSAKNFEFSGGAISGTGKIIKLGSGKLTLSSLCENSLALTNGTVEVTASGSIGSVVAVAGTVFKNSGTAFGLTSLGASSSDGIISGPVSINGGTFLNSGTIYTRPGGLLITNAVATNTASGRIDVGVGNWTIERNGILVNNGVINNLAGRLNINLGGALTGTGSVIDPNSAYTGNPDGRIAVNTGSLLSPGGTAYNSIGTLYAGGRLDLNSANGLAGVLRIEFDFSHPQVHDVVGADELANSVGMIQITNINPGAGTFASGQSFLVISNNNGPTIPFILGDRPEQMPVIWPPAPGPGLAWYLRDLRTNGIIGITNPLVWRGTVNANWDRVTANWLGGAVYSDERGVLFDDSVGSGPTDVYLSEVVAPGSPADYHTNMSVFPGIIVSNASKAYTFKGDLGGRISGKSGLYKTGPGTLTIEITTNDYTGPTFVDGGTLAITMLTNWNVVSSLGQPSRSAQSEGNTAPISINQATLKYLGPSSASGRWFLFGAGGATFDIPNSATALTLSKRIVGPGALIKTGPGILQLNEAGNIYEGGTLIQEGTLRLNAAAAGYGGITLASGSTLELLNAFTFTNAVSIPGDGATLVVNRTNVSSGAWSGNGSVTISNLGLFTFNGNIAGFGGTISLGSSSGALRFNNGSANDCLGSAAATFDLGTGSGSLYNLNGGGLTYDLGALAGGPNTVLAGRSSTSGTPGTTYRIGANGSNTVFSGTITNGTDVVSVLKVGSGKLTLNGNNGYTGSTTVSAGTLAGSGTFLGPVTVEAGGTLSPGASLGTMGISNSLTLAGTLVMEVSRDGATLSSDRIVGLTSVTFGGTLIISNVGPSALQAGDSFQLFNLGSSQDFASIIVPALPSSTLAWSFDKATGVLSVVDNRPRLEVVVGANTLQFSWSAAGYRLQAQTNSLSTGLGNTWFDYPGGGASPVTVPINPANPTVFFRLSN